MRVKAVFPAIQCVVRWISTLQTSESSDLDELDGVYVKEMAIHRKVSKLSYSRRCAEASAVQAHMKKGIPQAPGMEIG